MSEVQTFDVSVYVMVQHQVVRKSVID